MYVRTQDILYIIENRTHRTRQILYKSFYFVFFDTVALKIKTTVMCAPVEVEGLPFEEFY